ncbi:MAG: energy transducer TonB [Candidatus Sphingomonas colombiensis]|nr:energy transducer TonB [Sphingomonas sp.]WEK42323.1 MAG: energy transducer TonB [Sphingomonas sp.]
MSGEAILAALVSLQAPALPATVGSKLCTDERLSAADQSAYAAFDRGLDKNSIDQIEAFIARNPASACVTDANKYLYERRQAALRIAALPRVENPKPIPFRRIVDVFSDANYPASARRNNQQGVTEVVWDVMPDGYVENCRATLTSGFDALDDGTCAIVTSGMRCSPARDKDGSPTVATDTLRMNWKLPGQ